uniref:CSON014832 protein n=1 Tax=Culicoides sonorensis TaxID=179676 RepID=A0A336KTH1_CULSO
MTTELSAGFLEDCHAFIEQFISCDSLDFTDFCNIWNKMNFHCIFYGRQSVDDLNSFIEETFIIIKRIFIRSTNLAEKCCCLYLLYAIYISQPDKFIAKVRITQNDWKFFKCFYDELKGEECQCAFIIWWKLLQQDAYHFCFHESKQLFDNQTKSDTSKTSALDSQLQFKPISGLILHELESLQTNHGIFSALEALEIAYNEMKEHLEQPNDLDESVEMQERTLPASTLVKDVSESMKEIQDLLTQSKTSRVKKRKRRATESNKHEEDEDELDEKSDNRQSIKDKRKSIRDRAFKDIKKKRGSVTDKKVEQPSSSSQEINESPVKIRSKPIVDQKHFKKITEVQKIFELNSLLEQDTEVENPKDHAQEGVTSTSKKPNESSNKKKS